MIRKMTMTEAVALGKGLAEDIIKEWQGGNPFLDDRPMDEYGHIDIYTDIPYLSAREARKFMQNNGDDRLVKIRMGIERKIETPGDSLFTSGKREKEKILRTVYKQMESSLAECYSKLMQKANSKILSHNKKVKIK
jgi:hypothetical protein